MSYPMTMKALSIVDAHIDERQALWDAALTNAAIEFCIHVDFMREDYVRQAFLADTSDRNSWSQVRVMGVEDIRKIVGAGRRVRAVAA